MTTQAFTGVMSPVLTPFDNDLKPNGRKLAAFCKQLLAEGCTSLSPFGTNSEANSMSVEERIDLLDQIIDSGIDPKKLMPGTGSCALSDAVRASKHATQRGCGGVMVLPPFYYKNMTDDGFYRFFAEMIQRVGDAKMKIYLYHIPPQTVQGISLDLIERLIKAYPTTVVGIKDSSGDWKNTSGMLERFQPQGFDVFAGSETFLLANMRGGGAGCITATGNVNPGPIVKLYKEWKSADADAQQATLDITRAAFAKYPMIPAMKAAIAWKAGRKDWGTVRPPLVELGPEQQVGLQQALDAAGFELPNAQALA